MARFLSDEWFDDVRRHSPADPGAGTGPAAAETLVVEQVVRDTPGGEVRYRVVIAGDTAQIERGSNGPKPDLTITCSWDTASAMAQGRLSAQAALMEGQLRIRGNVGRAASGLDASSAGRARRPPTRRTPGDQTIGQLSGLDPVPAEVRSRTTY
jgi:hypothetical protein